MEKIEKVNEVENREVKSDVFSMLMEDKRYALQVYNSLNNSNYTDPDMVELVTLEKGISLSIRNDASFIVGMDMNIYEHQSTYNPNMPLRLVIYFSETIKKLIKERDLDLYGRKPIMIPSPHFAVFYNGTENRPPIESLKLSDLFANKTDDKELELTCTVYNINPGKNDDFLENCSILKEYTTFIEKVREYKDNNLEKPIEAAIEWCIANDILKEFLTTHKPEVLKAMTIDMTWEHREKIIRREEREEGYNLGLTQGREEQKCADDILLQEKNDRIAKLEAEIERLKNK